MSTSSVLLKSRRTTVSMIGNGVNSTKLFEQSAPCDAIVGERCHCDNSPVNYINLYVQFSATQIHDIKKA